MGQPRPGGENLVETINSLGLKYPEVTADKLKAIEAAKKQLEKEKE